MNKLYLYPILFSLLGSNCNNVSPVKEKLPEFDMTSNPVQLVPRDNDGIMELLEIESYQVIFNKNQLSTRQTDNLLEIMNAAKIYDYDVYTLLAIAFRESSFHNDVISDTGDVGIFQINYRWWGKELGYKDFKDFYQANIKIKRNTRHAIEILRRFTKHRSCKGDNVFACYNGGYGWRKSNQKRYIEHYRDNVVKTRNYLKERYQEWSR